MKRSKSSREWLERQRNDEYVKKATAEGYRSRAAYKLKEIQARDRVFAPHMTVVDLGAAPGGWSQVAVEYVGKGNVLALDILPIDPIEGVDIILGDFREQAVHDELLQRLNNRQVDLVISDMAPNFSGIRGVDIPRAIYLAELALDFAQEVLEPNGSLVVKLFQGEGFTEYVHMLKMAFKSVVVRKPKASRSESSEVYVLALKFKGKGVQA
jgi:23S rRNA (uridine2552-2'-O)-methyltransferase